MTLNSGAIATELANVLNGLDGLSGAQIGAPISEPTRLAAYVTMGSQTTGRKRTGSIERSTRFFVLFMYRVDKNETAAETALMGLVDAFMNALHADLTLNGVVSDLQANSVAADEPDYQLRVGKEFREYPVVVTVKQYGSYAVNP